MEEFLINLLKGILYAFAGISIIWVLISYTTNPLKNFGIIHSRWQHTFDGVHFSPLDVYKKIEYAVQERAIPNVEFARGTHSHYTFFLSKREYLQVRMGEHIFLICAAPFGKGFFISWWLGESISFMQDLVPRFPLIGNWLAKSMFDKTFFEMDTEAMFKGLVKHCVMEVIDGLTTAQGMRPLTEAERTPIDLPAPKRI